eukprot:CAMPEP_0194372934 /NCGR_PEP_ID=MMETSP0174-20130528/21353_1 /TAXON_ID=216777 /ORGANISM="Proboscia alata, Strain PI-D3" /LENGTH=421 /DNA_ID=CAMNT_0039151723 /DNA_START=22 /DNA_END=1283 /DNA_ORIENTATION=-
MRFTNGTPVVRNIQNVNVPTKIFVIILSLILWIHPSVSFSLVPQTAQSITSRTILERNGPYTHGRSSQRSTALFAQSKPTRPPNSPKKKSRQKKNKYAKFSNLQTNDLDPHEQMLKEAEEFNKSLLLKKRTSQNVVSATERLKENDPHETEGRERNKLTFPPPETIDPYDPTTFGFVELGTILGPHGVFGSLKIKSETDFGEERLCVKEQTDGTKGVGVPRYMKPPNKLVPREIRLLEGKLRLHDEYIIRLEGIGTRDAALKLRGAVLFAREEDRPTLDEDEFLVKDLVGLEVYHLDQREIDLDSNDDDLRESREKSDYLVGIVGGIVIGEEITGVKGLGNDAMEVILPYDPTKLNEQQQSLTLALKSNQQMRKSPDLVLIPFVPQIVPIVDVERNRVYIDPPEGLLDLTYRNEPKTVIRG